MGFSIGSLLNPAGLVGDAVGSLLGGSSGGGPTSLDDHHALIVPAGAEGKDNDNNLTVGTNTGVITTAAPEVAESAFEYGEKVADTNYRTSKAALDNMRGVAERGMTFAQNVNRDSLRLAQNMNMDTLRNMTDTARNSMRLTERVAGEAFEKIEESNERNSELVSRTLNIGKQQSSEAMDALAGVITRNQIGAAQIQVKNMNKLIYMVGAVLIVGYVMNGRRRYGK